MKPTKNRIYCPVCGRTKMLFPTETKANTFIKFNSDGIAELNGKAPIRSYYCDACMGYHVTSQPARETLSNRTLTDKVISSYYKDKANEFLGKRNINLQYIGLFPNDESRIKLFELLGKYPEYQLLYNAEDTRRFMHHCTLLHISQTKTEKGYEMLKSLYDKIGKTYTVQVVAIGKCETAAAFRLKLNSKIQTCNDTAHITICTFNGGKPVDSNKITEWTELSRPMEINTVCLFA